MNYVRREPQELLAIPSPSGFADETVRNVCIELGSLGVLSEMTRRGAIRADLIRATQGPDRAIVVHLDALGPMKNELNDNRRVASASIGTPPSRTAEGLA